MDTASLAIALPDRSMPDFRAHAVAVPSPGAVSVGDTTVLGLFLRDVAKLNQDGRNFRIFGPDETLSNMIGAVFEATGPQWDATIVEDDEFLAPRGQIHDSMFSEHQCQGWLEGYLLTGRHGLFNSYEAFIRIVDSMFSHHAKWLKVTREVPWRRDIASLNYLLASHVWQQDQNGFTHQDPGFLDHVINKKADAVRVYLPPDSNCLLSTFDHCLRSRHYVNVVVAGKHALPQWLTMEAAVIHCTQGLGIWQWASNDQDAEPDVVMACCGDTPRLEVLAAVSILREHLPRRGRAAIGAGPRSVTVLEAPAGVAGLDDVAVVGEPIEHGCGHLGVAEHLWPFRKSQVRRDEQRGLLIELADQVEQ